ncbi:MAG: cytochrome c-type biogenesis protein CcmH [Pseudomonadales bacterium]|nr:cytochrome c-type biogenesis protein CcmH [Pseudomonadales bacterium]
MDWLSNSLLILTLFGVTTIDVWDFQNQQEIERYDELIAEFRCPKCLNTNISGSDAPIAADLRRAVYRQIRAGMSDQEIRDYLQARYGDFVLYKTPFRGDTAILWISPVLFLVIGLFVLFRVTRKRTTVGLTEEDRTRIKKIVNGSR